MDQATEPTLELDEFEIPKKDLVRLMFRQWCVQSFWLTAYLSVFAAASFIATIDRFVGLIVVFGLFFPWPVMGFVLYVSARYYASSLSKNISSTKLSFGSDRYFVVAGDGSKGEGPLSHFVRADLQGGYYRVFLNQWVFMPISVTAFRSEADRERFEMEILGDKLKRKPFSLKALAVFVLISCLMIGLACLLRNPGRIVEQKQWERQNPINDHVDF